MAVPGRSASRPVQARPSPAITSSPAAPPVAPGRRRAGARVGRGLAATAKPGTDPWAIFNLNRETSDVELDEWGKRYIPGFLGVRARSQFNELYPPGRPMKPGTSAILNLDYGDYARGGTHWVGVRVAKDAPVLMYVDSFGLPPPRDVSIRGRLEGRGVLYPDVAYQRFDEVNCGPRALAALHYLASAKNDLEAFGQLGQR